MIKRGIRLTGLRRSILAALPLDRGEAVDTVKRWVALERAVAPDSPAWLVFKVSFSRALRHLERAGVIELRRDFELFRKACASWIRLTPLGRRERARVAAPNDQVLGRRALEDASRASFAELVARASDEELAALEALVAAERARRASHEISLVTAGISS
jgi:hypothetical protein